MKQIPQKISQRTSTKEIEEKQRLLKDRILLIGQNLIEFREKNNEDILSLKKEIEIIKINLEKINNFIETFSNEIEFFAKKEDLEILKKQAKMFQPLEFLTKHDLEKLKKKH